MGSCPDTDIDPNNLCLLNEHLWLKLLILTGVSLSWINLYELQTGASRSDEGLTLETSSFKLFTVANLRFQLGW